MRKRQLDRIFFVNRFLMDREFSALYDSFMSSCFETYTGAGQDAKLRANARMHHLQRGSWDEAWDDNFVKDAPKVTSPGTVEVHYEAVMQCFAREIGVGNPPDR